MESDTETTHKGGELMDNKTNNDVYQETRNVKKLIKSGKRNKIIIIALVIIIIGVVGFLVYNSIQLDIIERENIAFQSGAQYTYENMLIELYNDAITCEPIIITNNETTLNLIAIECLQEQ